jgi:uncharacterized protein YkwD
MTRLKYALFAPILLACAAPPACAQEEPIDLEGIRAAVLAETNAYRASKNAPQLQRNGKLEAAATAYAAYLAEHEAMGHTADGGNPAKRAAAQGYKFCSISENVWSTFRKPETSLSDEVARRAMEGWKKSPGHNANLLEKRWREIGIGAAGWRHSGGGQHIFRVVQVFTGECAAKRQPKPPRVKAPAGNKA